MTIQEAVARLTRAELEEIAVRATETCNACASRGGLMMPQTIYGPIDRLGAALRAFRVPICDTVWGE